MSEQQDPALEPDEDVEGHLSTPHAGRPGNGSAVGGRFRPDEDEMFGEDVQGHLADESADVSADESAEQETDGQ